ncbi:MAG: DEAD/DEAH box helicase [Pseudomonadota bacterium]
MSFDSLGLSAELLKAVAEQGYEIPTPVQQQAIPAICDGRDVMAAAQTGTGKTAGFVLPMLHRLAGDERASVGQPTALVLAPTRELAAQIGDNATAYGKHVPVTHAVVFGGVNIKGQIETLSASVDILVATPGRLLDLHQQGVIGFDALQVLVLDEADRMLDMGFIHDIKRILALLPERRQNLMFSATFSDDIRALARDLVHDPVEISVNPPNSTVEAVEQTVLTVNKSQKWRVLVHLINEHNWPQVLVFSRTKHGANRLVRHLEKAEITALAIHGNKSQSARTRALAEFKAGDIRVLVATDIAARGLDIDQLPHVVNYDLPNVPEDYVHRIGRTGRAGASGKALSLVCGEEGKLLADIEAFTGLKIERGDVVGFEFTDEWVLDAAPGRNRDGQRQATDTKSGRQRGNKGGGDKGDNSNEAQAAENKPARKRNRKDRQAKQREHDEDRQPLDNANLPPTLEHSGNRAAPQRPTRNANRAQRRGGDANGNAAYQIGEDDLPEVNGNRIDGPEVHEGTLWMQPADPGMNEYRQQNGNRQRRGNGNGNNANSNRARSRNGNGGGNANGNNRNRKQGRGNNSGGAAAQNRQGQSQGGAGQQQRRRRRRQQST